MHLHIISRKTAIKHGLKKYFVGKPCGNGGVGERYVRGECLCEICRLEKYSKKKIRYHSNIELSRACQQEYVQKKLEEVIGYKKMYYQKNKKEIYEKRRAYIKRKPELHQAMSIKRRCASIERVAPWFGELDKFVAEESKSLAMDREIATGIKWHVDHCVPLLSKTASGLHCATNLQVIPAYVNLSKINKMIMIEPFDWISYA